MKALRSDLAVRLVVPPAVRHEFATHRPELADGLAPEDLAVIWALGGSSNMSYMLDPFSLASLMSRFAPTHVHIDCGAVIRGRRISGRADLAHGQCSTFCQA
jgi:hypothetical protein